MIPHHCEARGVGAELVAEASGGRRHGTEVEIVQSEEREDGGVEIVIVGRRKLTLISEPELLPGLGYTVGRVSFSEAAEASPGGVPETDELSLSLQLEPHVEEWQRCVRVPPSSTPWNSTYDAGIFYSARRFEAFNHGMAGFKTTCASESSLCSLCSNSGEPIIRKEGGTAVLWGKVGRSAHSRTHPATTPPLVYVSRAGWYARAGTSDRPTSWRSSSAIWGPCRRRRTATTAPYGWPP